MKPPSLLAAVDPGLERCGLAIFEHGKLIDTALITANPKPPAMAGEVERAQAVATATIRRFVACSPSEGTVVGALVGARLVVEWPRIYMPGKSKGAGRDILVLACVDGALAALAASRGAVVTQVTPDTWKGQLLDKLMMGRVIGTGAADDRLSPPERLIAVSALDGIAASLRHNVIDAIGIGLYALGRFEPRREFTTF